MAFCFSATGLFIELRSIGFRFSFRQKIGVRGSIPSLSRMAAQAPYPGYPL
jgi:hypothetical protein